MVAIRCILFKMCRMYFMNIFKILKIEKISLRHIVLRKKNSLFRRSLRGAASSGDLRLVFAVDALRDPFVPLQDLRASGGALFGGKNAAAFLGGLLCPFGRGASFFGGLPFDGGSGQGRECGEQIEQTEFFHARAPRKIFALFSCDLRRAVSSFGSCGAIKTGKEGGT